MGHAIHTRLTATARRPTPAAAAAIIMPALILILAAAVMPPSQSSAPDITAGLPRAYGEGGQDGTTGASLWIPPKMIAGNRYHGVVVTDRATADGSFILLSSSDGGRTLVLPESATAPPHGNHAVFPITPAAGGAAKVFAAVGGGLLEADTRVYLPRSVPASLDVILAANTTEAPVMTGYVVVRDGNGAPTATTGGGSARGSGRDRTHRPPDRRRPDPQGRVVCAV